MSDCEYDRSYSEVADLFGDPSELVETYGDFFPKGFPVLDVGVGQGRNSLPLVQRAFEVVGIDPSEIALQQVQEVVEQGGVDHRFTPFHGSFEDFESSDGIFGAILVFGLIQILERSQIETLFKRARGWLAEGGVLIVTGWHVGDPSYQRIADTWQPIGPHSFRRPDQGDVRTFLEADEILGLAGDLQVMHHLEELGPWHQHGDGEQERHGIVELVARLG